MRGHLVWKRGFRYSGGKLRSTRITRSALDPCAGFGNSAAANRKPLRMNKPIVSGRRRIIWVNVMTVVSAAILIGAEVFGAAFAGGWAFANLFNLGYNGVLLLQGLFFILGM